MKTLIKSLIPKPIYEFLRERRRQRSEQRYFKQGFKTIKCGAYEIEAPENHLIVNISQSQPYRDLCVGITAKYISRKYPDGTMIDVGANIGDTAALISTYAQNNLILVEANDYFYDILVRNIEKIPNEITLKKVLLSDGDPVSGSFVHKSGTAFFQEESDNTMQVKTERLADVADDKTCYIKIDTDGYDRKILLASLDWLTNIHPAVLFESYIHNIQELESANELYSKLMQVGYKYFIVWDDPGFHLLSTTSLDVLTDLNRYLFKVFQIDARKSIYNYDILCLHDEDEDIYEDIREWYKNY